MRSSFPLIFLAIQLCFAQTATLRPEAAPLEDPRLRAEAIRLMEQANRISTPTTWPPNQMSIHFRLGQPDPGQPFEGDYVSSVGGFAMRRQEWRYGTYEQIQTRNGGNVNVLRAQGVSPGFLPLIHQLTPAWLVHFDHEDIIRSISNGPDGSRCIDFESVFGDSHQQNRICVDAQHGWLVSTRLGEQITRNSNYFAFNGAFLPGHVERYAGDQLVMTVDQTIVPKEFPPDFFGVPENRVTCRDWRRPTPVSTPQPAPLTASQAVYDIVLTGLISPEGKVSSLKSLDNVHPDLNREAMDLVSGWTFSGGTCDGKGITAVETFVVHFKGR